MKRRDFLKVCAVGAVSPVALAVPKVAYAKVATVGDIRNCIDTLDAQPVHSVTGSMSGIIREGDIINISGSEEYTGQYRITRVVESTFDVKKYNGR